MSAVWSKVREEPVMPLVYCLLILSAAVAQDRVDACVLLQGGTIYDGSGAPGVVGDVAIKGDRIVAVGTFTPREIGRTIVCRGMLIAPGFIDLHTHSDNQVTDPLLRGSVNYLMQGCTTQVTGNCGSGPTDVAEYYKKIDAGGAGTNVAHLVPQGSVREKVIGDVDRKATSDELVKMQELVEQGMRDGAWGMATGLIYVPSVYADTDELISLNKAVGKHGGFYASHIRGEGTELLSAVKEAIRIGHEGGTPSHVSHFKASGQESWGTLRLAIELIEQARGKGEKVTADQYPYTASSTSLEATIVPTWARSGGNDELVKRLDSEETSAKLKSDIARSLELKDHGAAVFIARYKPKRAWVGKNLKQIAESDQRPVLDVALEIIRNGGAAIVNFSMSEDDVRLGMQQPWVATASDGRAYLPGADKPHPRSYGTFSRKIGRYALIEGVLPVEAAIRSASGLPAEILGLPERGRLTAGFYADVVVLDPKEYRDAATFDDPHQYSRGVSYVFVNGQPAVHQGLPTGTLAGRALRHASTAPAE
jgi:N-acyl-D-aspartate/D-glutamate deacylase